ncbi:ATP-binding protein [Rhodoferax sp. GW822-FHT02A01]|uniref:ATP-binding response regulator n=1 Tax=Rhodoferax sp. GW822-FHT02A01 TaxID=3141537 RepID=UPI00315DECF3
MTRSQLAPIQLLEVQRELFRLGYRNLRSHVFGQICLSLLVAAGVWAAAPHQRVMLWALSMQLVAGVLYAAVWFFRHKVARPVPDPQVLRQWQITNFFLVSIAGLAWGSLGLLFVVNAQVSNLVVMTSFAGALAYSAVSNVYDMRAFYASVLLGTVALTSQLPEIFGEQAPFVIGMCVLYLMVLVLIARSTHRTLIDSIQLRLDNEQLALTNAAHAARAEKANRDKSEFLAAASHDLRQPVHALLLLIEAYRQSEPQAANHPLIQKIAAAGTSVSSLFNALMELSRLDSGTERVTLEGLDLPALLRDTLEPVRPKATYKGLAMRLRIASTLEHVVMRTDKLLLERILGNLLSNAVRYSAKGGVLLALRPAHGGHGLWLEVWDTGVGIAPQDHERIFDHYVQIGNRERDRSKGLGLGLAIVRQSTALLGLRVTLHSRPGRGSCFRLHIPGELFMQMELPQVSTDVAQGEQLSKGVLAGRRILLIDDDVMVLQAMQALLGSWKIDLRCASVGTLRLVLDQCGPHWVPECIISDYRLPGELNGVALLDALLEHFPNVVGLLQTGELAQNVQAQAEESGYLVAFKPVSPDVLAHTLCAVLDRTSETRTA